MRVERARCDRSAISEHAELAPPACSVHTAVTSRTYGHLHQSLSSPDRVYSCKRARVYVTSGRVVQVMLFPFLILENDLRIVYARVHIHATTRPRAIYSHAQHASKHTDRGQTSRTPYVPPTHKRRRVRHASDEKRAPASTRREAAAAHGRGSDLLTDAQAARGRRGPQRPTSRGPFSRARASHQVIRGSSGARVRSTFASSRHPHEHLPPTTTICACGQGKGDG